MAFATNMGNHAAQSQRKRKSVICVRTAMSVKQISVCLENACLKIWFPSESVAFEKTAKHARASTNVYQASVVEGFASPKALTNTKSASRMTAKNA